MIIIYIYIKGISNKKYLITFQHLANLFFKGKVVSFEPVAQPFLTMEYKSLNKQSHIEMTVTIIEFPNGKGYKRSEKLAIANYNDRVYRQILLRLFVQILEDITNIKQPWGILTGIRPVKLYHKKRRLNYSDEQIALQLQENYLISNDKINLMEQITSHQLKAIPDLFQLKNEVSLYVGIPFCPTKCAYCTFPAYAIGSNEGSVPKFLKGLQAEIRGIGNWLKENNINVTTIYYGGGTPTSLTAGKMDLLYETMAKSIPNIKTVREITVEAGRPDTLDQEKLAVINNWQIDRISINPQTFKNETLATIGRHHSVEQTIDKFKLARSLGMKNINMDLIIGLPGEDVTDFNNTLAETVKLLPESVTVHTLAFKRASEMTKNKFNYKIASNKDVALMMENAKQLLAAHNYSPYYLYRQKNILNNLENIGFSQLGFESLYNIIIMEEQQTIIGLGCGASSKFINPQTGKIIRYANPKQPQAYENNLEKYINDKTHLLQTVFQRGKPLSNNI